MTRKLGKRVIAGAIGGFILLIAVVLLVQTVSGNQPIWTAALNDGATMTVFSGDGSTIAVGTEDGHVYVFEVESNVPIRNYDVGSEITWLCISENGKYMAACSGKDIVFFNTGIDTESWRYNGNQNDILIMSMTSNGKYTVVGTKDPLSTDKGKMYLFEKETSNPKLKYEPGNIDGAICSISGDGTYITVGEYHANDGENHTAEFTLYDFNGNSMIEKWSYVSDDDMILGGLSRDGTGLFALTYDYFDEEWPLFHFGIDDADPLWVLDDRGYEHLDISDDGSNIITIDDNDLLHYINGSVSDSVWTYDLSEGNEGIYGAGISGDGTRIAVGRDDGMLLVFDIGDGEEPLWEYDAGGEAIITSLSFPSSARYISVAIDDTINLFPREEILVNIIEESIPDPSPYADLITFPAMDHEKITMFKWRSDKDGVLYDGPSSSFLCMNLTLGQHLISLIVKDDEGEWSEPDSVYLNITAPGTTLLSDYSDVLNPTPFFHGPDGFFFNPPSFAIDNGVVVFSNSLLEDPDVYMYDISDPSSVALLSSPSYLAALNDPTTSSVKQNSPRIDGDRIVWQYTDSQDTKDVILYTIDSSYQGGDHFFDHIKLESQNFDFSGNHAIWTTSDFNDEFDIVYDLYVYKIGTGEVTIFEEMDNGAVALDGNRLLYLTGNDEIPFTTSGKAIIHILNLGNMTEEFNFTMNTDLSNIKSIDLSGDHIVWEDERHDKSDFDEFDNTDIYYLNWRELDMRRVTTEGSAQRNPRVGGNFIVYEDKRGGEYRSIHAYSITENKTAILVSNGTDNRSPQVDGNHAVWQYVNINPETYDSQTYYFLYRMGSAEWTTSETRDIFLKSGDDPGLPTGLGEAGDMPPYRSLDNTFFLITVVFITIGIATIGGSTARAKTMNMMIVIGTVIILMGAILGMMLIPLTLNDGEDYDAWIKEGQETNSTIKIGAYVDSVEALEAGTMTVYTYFLAGSDVPVFSSADLGEEGTFVIVDIQIDELGIPNVVAKSSPIIYVVPGILLILIGIGFAVKGSKRARPKFGALSTGGNYVKSEKEKKREKKQKLKEAAKRRKLGLPAIQSGLSPMLRDIVTKSGPPPTTVAPGSMPYPPMTQPFGGNVPPTTGMPPGAPPIFGKPSGAARGGIPGQPGMQSPAPGFGTGQPGIPGQSPAGFPPGSPSRPPMPGTPGYQMNQPPHMPYPGQPGMPPGPMGSAPGFPPQSQQQTRGQQPFPPQQPPGPGQQAFPPPQSPGVGQQPFPVPQPPGPALPPEYQSPPQYQGPWTCPNCGQSMEDQFKFCTSCGHHR